MTMTTKNNVNRTGIYVQESVDVTTAGDGLCPRGVKSPVAQHYDSSLNRIYLDDKQNQEQTTSYQRNPFKKSQLRSITGGVSESDTPDGKSDRNNRFRIQRNQQMKDEFLKLGFSGEEICVMQAALEVERINRHKQNKMIRYCEETNLDPESARQAWLERKERELVKYRAEKAAKIAAGTFNPIPFHERKRKICLEKDTDRGICRNRDRAKDQERERSSQGIIDNLNSTEFDIPQRLDQWETLQIERHTPFEMKQIFISPAILAGATEDDSPYSCEFRKKTAILMKQRALVRIKDFEEARRRMGLSGRHIWNRYSDSPPGFQDSPYSPETKKTKCEKIRAKYDLYALQDQYSIKVEILDKSHPVGEIRQENHFIMLDALETTIQDERVLGADWLKIGAAQYRKSRLCVYCKNIDTVKFLENKIPLYNRLWREADLFVTMEKVNYKRYRYRVYLLNYNLTSEDFFKIIKKQNGYPTERWTFSYRLKGGKHANNFNGWFVVDVESHRRLEESEGFVYFLFDKIQLCLYAPNNPNADTD